MNTHTNFTLSIWVTYNNSQPAAVLDPIMTGGALKEQELQRRILQLGFFRTWTWGNIPRHSMYGIFFLHLASLGSKCGKYTIN